MKYSTFFIAVVTFIGLVLPLTIARGTDGPASNDTTVGLTIFSATALELRLPTSCDYVKCLDRTKDCRQNFVAPGCLKEMISRIDVTKHFDLGRVECLECPTLRSSTSKKGKKDDRVEGLCIWLEQCDANRNPFTIPGRLVQDLLGDVQKCGCNTCGSVDLSHYDYPCGLLKVIYSPDSFSSANRGAPSFGMLLLLVGLTILSATALDAPSYTVNSATALDTPSYTVNSSATALENSSAGYEIECFDHDVEDCKKLHHDCSMSELWPVINKKAMFGDGRVKCIACQVDGSHNIANDPKVPGVCTALTEMDGKKIPGTKVIELLKRMYFTAGCFYCGAIEPVIPGHKHGHGRLVVMYTSDYARPHSAVGSYETTTRKPELTWQWALLHVALPMVVIILFAVFYP